MRKKHTLHGTEGDDEILYAGVHGDEERRGGVMSKSDTSAMFAVVYNRGDVKKHIK